MLFRFFTEEGEIVEERDTNQLIGAGDEITAGNQKWKVTSLGQPQKDLTDTTFRPVRVRRYKGWTHL